MWYVMKWLTGAMIIDERANPQVKARFLRVR